MKTMMVLGAFSAVALAVFSGCAGESTTGSGESNVNSRGGCSAEEIQNISNVDKLGECFKDSVPGPAQATGPKPLDIPNWIVDIKGKPLGAGGMLKFSDDSKLEIRTPRVTMDTNIGPGGYLTTRLNHMDVIVEAGIDAKLEVVFEGSGKLETGPGKPYADPTITFPVYSGILPVSVLGVAVPVMTEVNVEVGCSIGAAYDGRIAAGASFTAHVKRGIEYNLFSRYSKDPSLAGDFSGNADAWSPDYDDRDRKLDLTERFNSLDLANQWSGLKFEGEAKAQASGIADCWVEPRVAVSIGKVLGAQVSVKPHAVLGLGAKADTTIPESDAYMRYSLGLKVEGGMSGFVDLPFFRRWDSPTYTYLNLGSESPVVEGRIPFTR